MSLEVYSDSSGHPGVPNLVEANTGPDDQAAKWLKLAYMLKTWSSPAYKNVKWFVVGHDAIYLNTENLLRYLERKNHKKAVIIGDIHCSEEGVEYPSGASAIVFSRAVLEEIDWFVFQEPLRTTVRRSDFQYDFFIGQYAKRRGVILVPHPGMLASTISEETPLFSYLRSFSSQQEATDDTKDDQTTHSSWKHAVRLISSDQTEDVKFSQKLHQTMSGISYGTDITEKLFTCTCPSNSAGKCQINAPEAQSCVESEPTLACLAIASKA